ncbi:EAL and HDOD domain-containing protein [Comamonas testosteroni]|uniref:EAL and HDOD domain-containing protein n=1 Tax=Comamonas testosteroni TaxID=285 RepID=UPI0006802541|nr:HDOD domain-containing protein [Comamonas testosteroni]
MSEQTIEDQAFASPRNLSKGMIARQPIVNGLQQIIGYELFNRSRSPYGHTMASDATLIFAALTHAGEEDLVGTKLMFVNCTHEGLTGEHLELLPADKVVLEIPPLGHAAVHEVAARLPTLLALKEQGFHLAFNHTVLESVYAAWLPLADYIKLDLSTLAPDQLTVLVKFANRHTRAELIAEKVESAHQHELGQRLGIELFQGFWFARPTVMQTRLLTPTQQSIIQLLTLVREQASTDAIEEVLKKDAALAFNLLRLINSASFGAHRQITSFKQAVMMLGLNKLFRWAAMLLTAARDGGPPPAVGQTAVIRGRLMELLAKHSLTETDADLAFICGMFSMLDRMLGIPLPAALALIPVSESVSAALLHHEGILGELLMLTKACESHDQEQFDRSACSLELEHRDINQAHLQALSWTECLSE